MGKQNFITLQLLAISGILFSILVSMVAFRQFSLPESKADLSTQVDLAPPYLRIEKKSQTVVDGKKMITVDVFANTNGMPVTGADVVIRYDSKVVEIKDDDIKSTGAFAVLSVNSHESELLDFSLFSEKSRDEPIVQTNADQEISIVTLTFEVVDPSASLAQLELIATPNQLDDSNLVLDQDPRPELPTDVLKSVQPAIISL
ncbi:MAG: hypothetical protein ABI425_06015 [Patescibacteria group bacterium]